MPNDCLVSIIVPIYNREKYLNRCIDSILAQTYQNIELILVDDGSKDRSGAICDEYAQKDKRVKAIHIQNGGVSNARNTGIDNATGEYIFFVDSDDYILPTHIERLLPADDEDFVWGGYTSVSNGVVIGKMLPPIQSYFVAEFSRMENFAKEIAFPSALWMGCYKKSIIDKNQLRLDKTISIAEDRMFDLQYLSFCTKIGSRAVNAYCYEQEERNSLIGRYHKNKLKAERMINEIEESIAGKVLYAERWDNWWAALRHYYKWKKIGSKDTKKSAKEMLKKTYRDTYFRASIPYMRTHGSLDERVETYFMGYYKHIWYKPFYGCIAILNKIKNLFRKDKNNEQNI